MIKKGKETLKYSGIFLGANYCNEGRAFGQQKKVEREAVHHSRHVFHKEKEAHSGLAWKPFSVVLGIGIAIGIASPSFDPAVDSDPDSDSDFQAVFAQPFDVKTESGMNFIHSRVLKLEPGSFFEIKLKVHVNRDDPKKKRAAISRRPFFYR